MPFPALFVSSCSAFFVDLVLLNKGSITLLSPANHSYTSHLEPTWVVYTTTTSHHQHQHSPHFTVIALHTLISKCPANPVVPFTQTVTSAAPRLLGHPPQKPSPENYPSPSASYAGLLAHLLGPLQSRRERVTMPTIDHLDQVVHRVHIFLNLLTNTTGLGEADNTTAAAVVVAAVVVAAGEEVEEERAEMDHETILKVLSQDLKCHQEVQWVL